MMIFIPFICIISLALAEPPVGDGYPSARSGDVHDQHGYEQSHDQSYNFQTSLSQEYGPPADRSFGPSRNDMSTEYLPLNTRTSSARSGLSDSYGPPNPRSGLSQEYGVPSARSTAQQSPAPKALSTEYGVPNARSSPSQSYGTPAARRGLSQEHGIPFQSSDIARTPSGEYDVPEQRSPSEEYGVPSRRSSGRAPSQNYGAPAARSSKLSRNSLSQEYGVPSTRSGNFQQSYTTPKSFARSFASSSSRSSKGYSEFGARLLSTSYGAPTARNSGGYAQSAKALSQTYVAPNQRDLSETYGAPSTRGVSQEYGVPASRSADQETSAIASSYSAAYSRSSPADTYGAPTARDSMPSEEYGVPNQYSNLSNQGYSYARNGLEELLNQEPANYDFSYKVNDYESGSDFGHAETRQENRAEGSYFVVLPDGTKQIVEYEADERGFKPRISVEPADVARSTGYNDNAVEQARSALVPGGPY